MSVKSAFLVALGFVALGFSLPTQGPMIVKRGGPQDVVLTDAPVVSEANEVAPVKRGIVPQKIVLSEAPVVSEADEVAPVKRGIVPQKIVLSEAPVVSEADEVAPAKSGY